MTNSPELETPPPPGMKTFSIMWVGQFVSLMGSAMTGFAIPIWIFGQTERVQELALLGLAFMLPLIIMSPIAGTIVDRNNRKLMMILSDLAAGITTVALLVLVYFDVLAVWHLIVANVINGFFHSFQWPAYSAVISVMIPKEQYGRANGLVALAESGSRVFAPLMAGALLAVIGLQGILLIDIITFVFAIGTLLFIFIPDPVRTQEGQEGQGTLWSETVYGFQYIFQRPSLLGLQLIFLAGNFVVSLAFTTMAALILARTDQNELIFGWVSAMGAAGGVAGGLLMSVWGGPKPRVHGVLVGWILSGLFSTLLLGIGRAWPVWAVATFIGSAIIPVLNGSNQAIWQAKVAPDIQGRVFSIRRLIAWITVPVASLLAIPIADSWLEPAMREGGSLVDTFSWLVGSGPGAGIGLMFVFAGLMSTVVGFSGYLFPAIRNAETLLPDHDAMAKAEPEVGAESESEPVSGV